MAAQRGTLYLVGTPIGNLEDVTLRALRVLAGVDVIAAEDTRVTRRLLQRHNITRPLLSYHQRSGQRRLRQLLQMLQEGKQVALVCDAGMPGISDPGARLVRACAEAEIPMVVAPGPSAASSALALSGMAAKEYLFLGFPASRGGARRKALRRACDQPGAIVCFEAPHRLRESLDDMLAVLGDRQAICARELTKRFEQVVRGRVSDLIAHFASEEPRGEMTVVLAGARPSTADADLDQALAEVRELAAHGLSLSRAVSHVARHRRVPRGKLYRSAVRGEGDGE